ncbi:MAG: hypothetical protein IK117_02660 [Bacteroidales bacterium]|nr:hypothetical protein [Bacteroidales bacterium]
MSELVKRQIAKKENETTILFDSLIPNQTFLTVNYKSPEDYIKQYWEALQKADKPTLRGNIFEYIIYTLLYREGITPFYTQAKVAFVPNVNFDTLLYCQATPVSLSLKTSLRERYKQADLEAIALKYVHRKSKCYLLTMDSTEAKVQKAKILSGDIIGLDEIIDCNTNDINTLVDELKKMQFTTSQKIDVVEGNLVK